MRTTLSLILLFAFVATSAQTISTQDSTLFDFWVGEWNLSWTSADGTISKGSNSVMKVLDGKVLQENFSDANGEFKGMSVSVYNPLKKTWHQAWVDNQGGYFSFDGDTEGDKRIFKTQVKEQNGEKIIQRMAFYNIRYESFTWDWELTKDGGATWQLQWRIHYSRKL